MPEHDGATVTYSVAELLQQIRDSLSSMNERLSGKADRSDIEALNLRLTTIDDRVTTRIDTAEDRHQVALKSTEEKVGRRIDQVEDKLAENDARWARLTGIAIGAGAASGGLAAAIVRAVTG